MTLLGLEDIPDKKLMSGESIMNLIRIITALILAVLPVAATCCYAKYRGQSGRQMRILLWAHWTVTGLILVGYLCGALSAANWRLSPIVCTAFIVSMAFLRWAITKQKTMQRAAGVLCVPLACFCLLSACNVLLLPTNAEEVNVQYQLTNMLEKQGLTYGYATFWHANAITVISGEKLKVRNVSINENGVQKATYQTDSRWYEDQPEQKNYFLLLNNDTEMIDGGCIREMLGYCMREDVGIVGAKLLYADDTIQHAGVILGFGGTAGHAFIGKSRYDTGYFGRILCAQDYSAVTAACMMTKRQAFEAVGGMTGELAVAFNDVDYCLKVRKHGWLVVYDPYAEMHHYESKSRGYEDSPEKVERFNGEVEILLSRWRDQIEQGDPYYNPNLTLDNSDFSLRR